MNVLPEAQLLAIVVVGWLGLTLPASAHAFLDGALPRVGSQSAVPPAEVVLHFTQEVEPVFSKIEVMASSGASVTIGAPHTQPADATRLGISLGKLDPGTYTVVWHVISIDTHKTQGRFHFTVTRP